MSSRDFTSIWIPPISARPSIGSKRPSFRIANSLAKIPEPAGARTPDHCPEAHRFPLPGTTI